MVLGGDVFWSLVGLLIGQLLGGAVMALHAAQGPRLGLPQMISSRVQFGVYGACIPIALVCLMYLGFTATGTVLSGQAIGQLTGLSDSAGIFIFAAFIVLVTVLGYRVIHIIGRIASVLGIIAFVYLFSRLMLLSDIGDLLAIRHFSWASFLLAVSLAASWQIAFAPTWPTIHATCRRPPRRGRPSSPSASARCSAPRPRWSSGCSPQPWPTVSSPAARWPTSSAWAAAGPSPRCSTSASPSAR